MLAKTDETMMNVPVQELPAYDGFPEWWTLMSRPGAEFKAFKWLKRANVIAYVPAYTRKHRIRGGLCTQKEHAAIAGMIFVPSSMVTGLELRTRDHLFELAGVRLHFVAGQPMRLRKSDVELIRVMEARLNLPQEAKGVFFKKGQSVSFKDDVFLANWGGGTIVEIVDEQRIVVEVANLFGRATRVTVPASEIVAK